VPLTGQIEPLPESISPIWLEKAELIPRGYYWISRNHNNQHPPIGHYVVNEADIFNLLPHPDRLRSIGCCGPSGGHGENLICRYGHDIATTVADCCTAHFVFLHPSQVTTSLDASFDYQDWLLKLKGRLLIAAKKARAAF
jgi:hypothetical protein